MQKKTKGLVAGAAGVALMLSGTTLALWSDSASVDGATISSGNLAITAASSSWKDTSPDRTDSPHGIELSEFKMIPKDEITGTYSLTASLEGENMVAKLGFHPGASSGALDDVLQVDAVIKDENGNEVSVNPFDSSDTLYLVSADNGGDTSGADLVVGNGDTLTVTLTVTFPDQQNRDHVQESVSLAGSSVSLDQVRDAAAPGYN